MEPEKNPLALSLHDVQKMLEEMRCFVARRFDEVSFEINATGQMVGMSDEAMAKRFSEIMLVLNAISYSGDGRSPHNVGVELSAVVKTTEDAANRILDAATEIATLTNNKTVWTDPAQRATALDAINHQTDTILAACAFQDLTGQRIARTLENIRRAESELADTLKRMGLKIDITPAQRAAAVGADDEHAHSQADIDALFG